MDGTVPFEVGRDVSYMDDLVVGHGAVWILALGVAPGGFEGPGSVIRIDPQLNRVEATIPAGALNMGIGPGGLWITGCVDCDDDSRDS